MSDHRNSVYLFLDFILFVDDEFEVDPQSLKSIINSEGMTPVRVTAPVRRTLGGHALRQVIDIFGDSVFRDVVVTLTHRGLHQLFCILGPQIESSNKIFKIL